MIVYIITSLNFNFIIVKFEMVELIKTKFDVYMTAKGRVEIELQSLTYWIICTKYYEPLEKVTDTYLNYQHYFKLLILINQLLMSQKFNPLIAESVLSKMKIKEKKLGKFEQTLLKKLLIPYKFYLHKRCAVLNEVQEQQDSSTCFQLLNLIQLGSSFTQMLFILGRYFLQKVCFTVDFNVVLAQDLSNLYRNLTILLLKCPNLRIKEDLQKIHEKMYAIYYSCYFHKATRRYAPKWIQTDNGCESFTPKRNKKQVKFDEDQNKKSLDQIEKNLILQISTKESNEQNNDVEESQNSLWRNNYISQFSINEDERKIQERNNQNGRLQLLRSMERVLTQVQ